MYSNTQKMMNHDYLCTHLDGVLLMLASPQWPVISEASLSICQPHVNFVTKQPLLATVDGAYCIQCCIQYHQKNYFAREVHLPAARCVYGLQCERIMVCAANCMCSRYSTASLSKKEFISEMAQITAPPLFCPYIQNFYYYVRAPYHSVADGSA
jgi:hypothetical protein